MFECLTRSIRKCLKFVHHIIVHGQMKVSTFMLPRFETQSKTILFSDSIQGMIYCNNTISHSSKIRDRSILSGLLVKRLGVGGGGSDVSVTSSLVGAGGLLEGLGSSQVDAASGVVGGGVVGDEVEGEGSEHCEGWVSGGHSTSR